MSLRKSIETCRIGITRHSGIRPDEDGSGAVVKPSGGIKSLGQICLPSAEHFERGAAGQLGGDSQLSLGRVFGERREALEDNQE